MPLTKWLCRISAKGYLFHWTVNFGARRFDQSGGGGGSVAETTGGKVNLGYSREGPTGERVFTEENLKVQINISL